MKESYGMKSTSSVIAILILATIIHAAAFGQGSLRGIVRDSTTHDPIIGVNVFLMGTALGASTDIEGRFSITGIPERSFTVKVSCLGYEPKQIEVDFSKNNTMQLNIPMQQAILQGEEVVVTAQLKGQIAAINQQITSKTIINVVSEEKIKELPDANAAEAIGRLPGVSVIRSGGEAMGVVLRGLSSKFTNITVDGVKIPPTDPNTRDVDLSTLSQGALAGIELRKTLTPDQDADAIAGSVNLVTRKAPSERLLYVDTKGDYNYLMKSARQYDFSLRYGERFFDDLLGIQLQGNAERKIRSRENTSTGYGTYDNLSLPNAGTYDQSTYDNDYNINQFLVRFTDETRKRNGGQAILDVSTPDDGSVKLSGMYSETGSNLFTHERQYPAGTGGFDYNYQYTEMKTSTANGSLQGKNQILGFTLDWNAAFAQSRNDNPFGYRMSFTEASGGTYQPTKDHPEINLIPYANNNFQRAVLDSSQLIRRENFDKERTFHLDVSQKIAPWDMFANEIKVGGKYKEKSRWMSNGNYAWNNYRMFPGFSSQDGVPIDFNGTRFEGANSAPELSRFLDQSVPTRDLFGLYRMTPLVNVDALKQWASLTEHGIFPLSPPDYGPNGVAVLGDYFVTERVSSAFIMNTLDIGQDATLIFGVRAEKESNDYSAKYSDQSAGGTGSIVRLTGKVVDTTSSYSEIVWLPSAQVSLRPTDFLTLRFAAYRALARPDFNLRLPQFSFQDTPNGTNLVAGNPTLRDSKAWNYEVNAQVYDNSLGLFSISAFYKKIDDLYHQANNINVSWPTGGPTTPIGYKGWTTNDQSGFYHRLDVLLDELNMSSWKDNPYFSKYLHYTSNTFNLFLAYNSPTPSYAWGFEIEHQVNFGFLPVSWLQNVVLSYNISITRSRTDILFNQSVVDSGYVPATIRPARPESYNLYTDNVPIFVTRQSENQPEVYANVVLGYDFSGFSARVSVFYQDRYTRQYSANGTADVVVDAFTKWDLALKQQVTGNLALFLNVNNIFNKKETTSRLNNIFDWGSLPRTAELYGASIDFGARISL
jgi:TonB-dependent receptor